jgi:hypothetical protein
MPVLCYVICCLAYFAGILEAGVEGAVPNWKLLLFLWMIFSLVWIAALWACHEDFKAKHWDEVNRLVEAVKKADREKEELRRPALERCARED